MLQFLKAVAIDTFEIVYEESYKIFHVLKVTVVVSVREIAYAMFS